MTTRRPSTARRNGIIAGTILLLVGILITVGTYEAAASSPTGGTYFVAFGPIFIGILVLARALASRRPAARPYGMPSTPPTLGSGAGWPQVPAYAVPSMGPPAGAVTDAPVRFFGPCPRCATQIDHWYVPGEALRCPSCGAPLAPTNRPPR